MERKVGLLGRVNVPITVGLVVVSAAIGTIVVRILVPEVAGPLGFAASVAGGAAVVYAAYYAGASLDAGARSAKKERAFAMIRELNHIDFVRVRTIIKSQVRDRDVVPSELFDQILADEDV